MNKTIYVYFDDSYSKAPALIGMLSAQQIHGHEVFSFEFTNDWLHDNRCHLLDPDLQLFSGRQYLPENKSNFGFSLTLPLTVGEEFYLKEEKVVELRRKTGLG